MGIGKHRDTVADLSILHHVALLREEVLPNGYELARTKDGDLNAHDRQNFRGWAGRWSEDRFRVQWFDWTIGIWRTRRTFKTMNAAEQFLRRIVAAYPKVQA